jgi:hypothetical protein
MISISLLRNAYLLFCFCHLSSSQTYRNSNGSTGNRIQQGRWRFMITFKALEHESEIFSSWVVVIKLRIGEHEVERHELIAPRQRDRLDGR